MENHIHMEDHMENHSYGGSDSCGGHMENHIHM